MKKYIVAALTFLVSVAGYAGSLSTVHMLMIQPDMQTGELVIQESEAYSICVEPARTFYNIKTRTTVTITGIPGDSESPMCLPEQYIDRPAFLNADYYRVYRSMIKK